MNRAIVTAAVTAVLAQAALSQSLEDVLTRHYKARGGLKAIRAVKTVHITGSIKMMGREFDLTILRKRPGMVRTDYRMGDKTFVESYDGKTGWQINPMMGSAAPSDLAGGELESIREMADMDGPLVDWKDKGYTLRLVGKEDLDGKAAFHISVLKDTAVVRDVFLDASSYLVVQEKTRELVRGKQYEIVTTFQDFKRIKGLQFAFRQKLTGAMPQDMVFNKIELDKAVEDSLFSKPGAK